MSKLGRHDELDRVLDNAARAVGDEEVAMAGHPETEELVGYQEKRLTEAATQRVRRHLAVCEECAQDVLASGSFDLDRVDPELLPSSSEVAASWDAFQHDLARQTPAPSPDAKDPGSEPYEPLVIGKLNSLAMAASIVLAFGLGYLVSDLRQEGDREVSNPFMMDLLPDGAMPIRDASSESEVAVPRGMDPLILRLNLGDQTPYAQYRAEILDADGASRWSREDLRRQPAGQFIVWVERARVPEGLYELRLFGIGKGEAEILATYSFRLRDAPED